MNEQFTEKSGQTIKPRKAFIALVYSLFFPGMGQIYNGQIKKVIYFYILYISIPFLLAITGISTYFYGIVLFFTVLITLMIYLHIDAWINARRQSCFVPKKYNSWYSLYSFLYCHSR